MLNPDALLTGFCSLNCVLSLEFVDRTILVESFIGGHYSLSEARAVNIESCISVAYLLHYAHHKPYNSRNTDKYRCNKICIEERTDE